MLDDDIGTKYTTTHRCFGSPCPDNSENVQLSQPDYFKGSPPYDVVEGTYKIGDMQDHRYQNVRAWTADEWPHGESSKKEDITKFVIDRFVPEEGRILSDEEVKDTAD